MRPQLNDLFGFRLLASAASNVHPKTGGEPRSETTSRLSAKVGGEPEISRLSAKAGGEPPAR